MVGGTRIVCAEAIDGYSKKTTIINLQNKKQNSSPRTPVVEEYAANLPRCPWNFPPSGGQGESNPCPVREFPTLAAAEQVYHRSGGE